jgi:hypothetical protein
MALAAEMGTGRRAARAPACARPRRRRRRAPPPPPRGSLARRRGRPPPRLRPPPPTAPLLWLGPQRPAARRRRAPHCSPIARHRPPLRRRSTRGAAPPRQPRLSDPPRASERIEAAIATLPACRGASRAAGPGRRGSAGRRCVPRRPRGASPLARASRHQFLNAIQSILVPPGGASLAVPRGRPARRPPGWSTVSAARRGGVKWLSETDHAWDGVDGGSPTARAAGWLRARRPAGPRARCRAAGRPWEGLK